MGRRRRVTAPSGHAQQCKGVVLATGAASSGGDRRRRRLHGEEHRYLVLRRCSTERLVTSHDESGGHGAAASCLSPNTKGTMSSHYQIRETEHLCATHNGDDRATWSAGGTRGGTAHCMTSLPRTAAPPRACMHMKELSLDSSFVEASMLNHHVKGRLSPQQMGVVAAGHPQQKGRARQDNVAARGR